MQKIQEKEFYEAVKNAKAGECKEHEFVKIYNLGSHDNFGCIKCGYRTLVLNE